MFVVPDTLSDDDSNMESVTMYTATKEEVKLLKAKLNEEQQGQMGISKYTSSVNLINYSFVWIFITGHNNQEKFNGRVPHTLPKKPTRVIVIN